MKPKLEYFTWKRTYISRSEAIALMVEIVEKDKELKEGEVRITVLFRDELYNKE